MLKKAFHAVILGAPASGKGTISKRIVEKYNFEHISPGDILRLNVHQKTSLGKKVKVYMNEGQLVPDNIITQCILERINELDNKSWLLDGFPRTLKQAEVLSKEYTLNAVIALNVPHKIIIDRVKNRWLHLPSGRVYNKGFNEPKVPGKDDITGEDLIQRDDDKPEILGRRLRDYDDNILKPVIQYYTNKDLVTVFHGETTAEIWPKIDTFLSKKLML